MNKSLCFDDVLIIPNFSYVRSRKLVDTSTTVGGLFLDKAIISANMDSVTGHRMAQAMKDQGAAGALHRFCSIEENVEQYKKSPNKTVVSVGLGDNELERAKALYDAGAEYFLIDVAHGASMYVVEQAKKLRELLGENVSIWAGNFATAKNIEHFNDFLGEKLNAYKVGIGGGSLCTTRMVTGCGMPTFSSVLDCSLLGLDIIADGGIRNSGDYAKALAAGAKAVMVGKLLAGTEESPAANVYDGETCSIIQKVYRGSASLESYLVQGKIADHRTPEGESTYIPFTGSVKDVIQNLDAGLRSSMSYVGVANLEQFRKYATFTTITTNGTTENKAHAKKE